MGHFFDFTSGKMFNKISDSSAIDSEGHLFTKLGGKMAMDLDTGDILVKTSSNTAMDLNSGKTHIFSSSFDDDE